LPKNASIRFASVKAWEDFSHDDDEEAYVSSTSLSGGLQRQTMMLTYNRVKELFADKGVTLQEGISSTHGMPPIHNVV
jgi:hypothetical protein